MLTYFVNKKVVDNCSAAHSRLPRVAFGSFIVQIPVPRELYVFTIRHKMAVYDNPHKNLHPNRKLRECDL